MLLLLNQVQTEKEAKERERQREGGNDGSNGRRVLRQMEEIAREKITQEGELKTAEVILVLAEMMGNTCSFLPLCPRATQLLRENRGV